MNEEQLKAFVKTSRRLSTDAFDENEINHLIKAGKEDISEATGRDFDISNMNHCIAVALYVRAMFGEGDEKAWALYQNRLTVIGTRAIR